MPTLRPRSTNPCPLAGVLAGARSADTVLENRTRPFVRAGRDLATITSGSVPERRRFLPAVGTSAALSLTDHDHGGPAERVLLTIVSGPQKMHVESLRSAA